MTRFVREEVQKVVDFYQPYENDDKHLCRCAACAAKAGNAPIYERRKFLKKRMCQDHMAKEGHSRPRGRPRRVALPVASVIQDGPSFYSVRQISLAKIHDLRLESQAFQSGASQAGGDIDFQGLDQADFQEAAGTFAVSHQLWLPLHAVLFGRSFMRNSMCRQH